MVSLRDEIKYELVGHSLGQEVHSGEPGQPQARLKRLGRHHHPLGPSHDGAGVLLRGEFESRVSICAINCVSRDLPVRAGSRSVRKSTLAATATQPVAVRRPFANFVSGYMRLMGVVYLPPSQCLFGFIPRVRFLRVRIPLWRLHPRRKIVGRRGARYVIFSSRSRRAWRCSYYCLGHAQETGTEIIRQGRPSCAKGGISYLWRTRRHFAR